MTATATPAPTVALVRRSARVRLLWLAVLVALLVAAGVTSLAVGSRQVAWHDVVAALGGARDGLDHAAVAVRVPRTALAALVGAALGLAGAVMQGVTRNPLADPGILGVTTGASLAVVVGIAWFGLTTATSKVWVAILGAGVTAVFVYVIGSLGRGGATPLKLALAGAATSAALSSFIAGVVLGRNDISGTVRSWQVGGVGGATFATMTPVLPFLAAGLVVCLACARSLDSLALGDDVAAGLGENVAVARGVASLGAIVLCGAATSVAGPIAFVGLVVPHACRLIVGPAHRWLLPFSALAGACLLLLGDVVGRVVARPEEIAVGIITAIVGAPFFIAIVRRRKVREL
ncbi:iron complex transport system permease protein [Flavimobilis soli]|uniref:Iron complex transport system permease protein n=1 Tax=Flavimobilis soli TaxID=442709 RepID=A0A2A9EE87_9MICO|nr:iron ABC transporter permease [Flavimobilis soli]PFG36946.1 iron complex transport system permease protein [Flavimobilis soli]